MSRSKSRFSDLARRRARERQRNFGPQDAGKVLGHDRYWDVAFLERLLNRVDDVSRNTPRAAAELSWPLPRLAEIIRIDPDDEMRYRDVREKTAYQIRAEAMRAHCVTRTGDPKRAEIHFERAFDHLRKADKVGAESVMDLWLRFATHQAARGEPAAAIETLDLAVRRASEEPGLAARWLVDALILRAHARSHSDAEGSLVAEDLSLALAHLPHEGRQSRRRVTIFEGLLPVLDDLSFEGIEDLARRVAATKVPHTSPGTRERMLAQWVEARLVGRLGIDRHATRLHARAHEEAVRREAWTDALRIRVDLALCRFTEDLSNVFSPDQEGDEHYPRERAVAIERYAEVASSLSEDGRLESREKLVQLRNALQKAAQRARSGR